MNEPHHDPPPSAAGQLDPYGARVTLRPAGVALDPTPFLIALLEESAQDLVDAGATVIGHLKCVLHVPGGTLACNLTSLRGGASCSVHGSTAASPVSRGQEAQLELAVLVYGLSSSRIDALVRASLARSLAPLSVEWSSSVRDTDGHTV